MSKKIVIVCVLFCLLRYPASSRRLMRTTELLILEFRISMPMILRTAETRIADLVVSVRNMQRTRKTGTARIREPIRTFLKSIGISAATLPVWPFTAA